MRVLSAASFNTVILLPPRSFSAPFPCSTHTYRMVLEEIKQSLGVHPRMPNWETHQMGTAQSLVSIQAQYMSSTAMTALLQLQKASNTALCAAERLACHHFAAGFFFPCTA